MSRLRPRRAALPERGLGRRLPLPGGAIRTMIQGFAPSRAFLRLPLGCRCDRRGKPGGNREPPGLTRPHPIPELHRPDLEARTDPIASDSLDGLAIAQADHGPGVPVPWPDRPGAGLAAGTRRRFERHDPLGRRLAAERHAPAVHSMTVRPELRDPASRAEELDRRAGALLEAAATRGAGGAGPPRVETLVHSLKARAALLAPGEPLDRLGGRPPVIADRGGRGDRIAAHRDPASIPPAAVAGFEFPHPASRGVLGWRSGRGPSEDEACRRGPDLAEAERRRAAPPDHDPE